MSIAIDANGNTLSDAQGRSFTWDYENRLTQAVVPGQSGGTITFKYDPFGRRIQKSGPLGTTNFLYDGFGFASNVIEEVDNSGNALARYTRTENLDEPLSQLRSGTTSYYHLDALSSVTSLSDGTGALAKTYGFDSFGKSTASTGTLVNPFQFTGRDFDSETGLYFNRARYFDPSTGRFISEDPIGFLGSGSNFYAYVGNNPVNLNDPSGLAHCIFSLHGLGDTGLLTCVPDKPGDPLVWFPANSGNNGDPQHHCRNNSECPPDNGHGPLPLGPYMFNGPSISHANSGGQHLLPYDPNNPGRDGRYLTHSCPGPFGPGTAVNARGHYCSEGCITSTPDNIRTLNNLINNEPWSTLLVTE